MERIVDYAISQGKRSFVALVPDNAYGSVVEAAFKQLVPAKGGRVIALERYRPDDAAMQGPVRQIAQAASGASACSLFRTAATPSPGSPGCWRRPA